MLFLYKLCHVLTFHIDLLTKNIQMTDVLFEIIIA